MTAANDTPQNVITLQQHQGRDAGTERMGDLLKQVRTTTLRRVGELLGSMFDNVDDALFDLAERAGSNAVQTEYFDGMREVRRKRQRVERLFLEQLTRGFAEFAEGTLKAARPETAPQQPAAGLSLVDDAELEESLAVSSMVAKAEGRLQRTLFALNQRLAVTVGGNKVEDATNPLGPATLAHAFRAAGAELELKIQVKLIIYKLFDRYVMGGLELVYDEANNELVQAGVLPQLRHAPAARISAPRPPAHGGAGVAPGEAQADGGHTEDDAGFQAELWNTLSSLLARRHPARAEAAQGAAAAMPRLDASDLLNALTILQGQTAQAPAAEMPQADPADAIGLKRSLLEQVARLGHDARTRRVSNADEDTIDLVAMLFEYILEDRNLPAQMQAILGRLQIPYLKVALLDKHLFAQKSHPARRLLDALAEAGKGWSAEADRDNQLRTRIEATVTAVLAEFDDDVGVFERELAAFNAFTAQHHRRAELAEQRAAEAARGKERLQHARRTAAQEILARISERDLPAVVHTVLSRPWANYLVLTLLRQGEDSEEWRNALRFADEFVWSAQPKATPSEIGRLKALLPQLEKALRHGLSTVAYHDSDVQRLMQELSAFYRRILDGQSVETRSAEDVIAANVLPPAPLPEASSGESGDAAPAAPVAAAPPPPPAASSPVEEIVLGTAAEEDPDAASEPLDDDDEHVQAVRALKVGTWFEFEQPDGSRDRAKLSWISPISSKYLFVNRRGLKVGDKTVQALAIELRRGTAVILEEVPLFDRALDAIVARLRETAPPGEALGGGTPG